MSRTIMLKNGAIVPEATVATTMISLREIIESDPIAFFEFIEICNNENHSLFGDTDKTLKNLGLIQSNGQPHDITKLIALAATEGDGLDLKLVSPYENQSEIKRATKKTSDIYDRELFSVIHRIANAIIEQTRPLGSPQDDRPCAQDWRKQSANPYYNQTNGLFLEFYYGHPSCLWTPWGKWKICGSSSGSWDKKDADGKSPVDKIMERLGTELYIPGEMTSSGYFGPVCALCSFDGIELPAPETLERSAYDKYEVVKSAWNELSGL